MSKPMDDHQVLEHLDGLDALSVHKDTPRAVGGQIAALAADLRHDLSWYETLEVCIVAAIRLPDGRVFRGHRHADAIRAAHDYIEYRHKAGHEPTGWGPGMCRDQGFITSRNRYVGREEGLQLQLAAGIESVAPDGYRRRELFSEDLYAD